MEAVIPQTLAPFMVWRDKVTLDWDDEARSEVGQSYWFFAGKKGSRHLQIPLYKPFKGLRRVPHSLAKSQ